MVSWKRYCWRKNEKSLSSNRKDRGVQSCREYEKDRCLSMPEWYDTVAERRLWLYSSKQVVVRLTVGLSSTRFWR